MSPRAPKLCIPFDMASPRKKRYHIRVSSLFRHITRCGPLAPKITRFSPGSKTHHLFFSLNNSMLQYLYRYKVAYTGCAENFIKILHDELTTPDMCIDLLNDRCCAT